MNTIKDIKGNFIWRKIDAYSDDTYASTWVAEVPGGWLFKVVHEAGTESGGYTISVALQFVPKAVEKI